LWWFFLFVVVFCGFFSFWLIIHSPAAGSTIVLGGDGRFFSAPALQTIVSMALAAGVARVLVGQHGLLSTPAVSAIIRHHHARGGIILTASHNPGGPTEDFGVKYNIASGGPAPESATAKMAAISKALTHFSTAELPPLDFSTLGTTVFNGGQFVVEVIDSVADYQQLLESVFDFAALRAILAPGSLACVVVCFALLCFVCLVFFVWFFLFVF
jgi:phosphoglucomutase